jgi:hypothetical protein
MTLVTILLTAIITFILTYFILKKLDLLKKQDERICNDYSTYNPSTLGTGLIGDMISIYRKKQLKTINTNLVTDDAHSIWFDLETIKKFIFHIEKGVQKNGSATKEKLGLRIYYAAYPKKATWKEEEYKDLSGFLGDHITEQYEDKHTLIMLPTTTINGINTDFNPFDSSTYTSGLPIYVKPISDIETFIDQTPTAKVKVMALTASSDDSNTITSSFTSTMAQNHGSLYPPNSIDGVTFP